MKKSCRAKREIILKMKLNSFDKSLKAENVSAYDSRKRHILGWILIYFSALHKNIDNLFRNYNPNLIYSPKI